MKSLKKKNTQINNDKNHFDILLIYQRETDTTWWKQKETCTSM